MSTHQGPRYSFGYRKAGAQGVGSTGTLHRQASPVVLRLPRSSQRTISWSGGRRKAWAGWVAPQGFWVWARKGGRSPGRQVMTGSDGNTHWRAYTSRLAGWGCLHIQGHSWGRRHSHTPAWASCLRLPAPVSSRLPLTPAACVTRGTSVAGGLAIRVQEASV